MPDPIDPPPDALRAHAAVLRAEADAIEQDLRDLAAHDRPDVWQGGRATDFRHGLDEWRYRLTAPGTGVTAELRDAARRIELRADLVAVDPAGG